VIGPERVLFDQATAACDQSDLPDAPARAFRNDKGEIVLFAPNFRNRALVGTELDTLTRDCSVRFAAAGNADPSLLDDRTWLHAFHTDDGRAIFALASASFIPYRHGMKCEAGDGERTDCWLNGIAALRSEDGGATFHYLGNPPHQVAFPPPEQYRPDVADPPGFVSATNIVAWNSDLFAILWRRGDDAERSRNCLARAPGGDPLVWEMWSGGRFLPASRFENGAWIVSTTDCDAIGPGSAIRGIVLHEKSRTFLSVFQYRTGSESGFYYATSTDLIEWSRPAPLLQIDLRRDAATGGEWAQYPSIIDGRSSDRNFGTVGDTAELIFVRFKPDAHTGKVTRQLVALPIGIASDVE
jgi:hypothetical protein